MPNDKIPVPRPKEAPKPEDAIGCLFLFFLFCLFCGVWGVWGIGWAFLWQAISILVLILVLGVSKQLRK